MYTTPLSGAQMGAARADRESRGEVMKERADAAKDGGNP